MPLRKLKGLANLGKYAWANTKKYRKEKEDKENVGYS
jgi:hypothetical protein